MTKLDKYIDGYYNDLLQGTSGYDLNDIYMTERKTHSSRSVGGM